MLSLFCMADPNTSCPDSELVVGLHANFRTSGTISTIKCHLHLSLRFKILWLMHNFHYYCDITNMINVNVLIFKR